MKKSAIAVAIVLLLVGVFALARRPVRVDVVRVRRGPIVESLVASGRVRPTTRVELAFETMGTVTSVTVSEGARVRRGEVLVQLDETASRASLDQARAQLAQAEATVTRLRGLDARVLDAELRNAEIALESARERERRERSLEAGGATTTANVDEAVRARQTAEATLARITERVRGLGRGGDEVRVALAAREAAQAAVRTAQANLDRFALRAPFDGIVLVRRVEPGQVVDRGMTLLELASTGPTELVLHADESHLARLSLGQAAVVSAESYPDRRFLAEVSQIAPAVDPLRGTVEVRLRLPEPPDYLRPDMTVSVEIETGREASARTLPNTVVHDLASARPWVFVVEQGVVAKRPIRLSLRGEDEVAVVFGLDGSTDVVATRDETLAPGQSVRIRRRR